jgi:hypothetical protein
MSLFSFPQYPRRSPGPRRQRHSHRLDQSITNEPGTGKKRQLHVCRYMFVVRSCQSRSSAETGVRIASGLVIVTRHHQARTSRGRPLAHQLQKSCCQGLNGQEQGLGDMGRASHAIACRPSKALPVLPLHSYISANPIVIPHAYCVVRTVHPRNRDCLPISEPAAYGHKRPRKQPRDATDHQAKALLISSAFYLSLCNPRDCLRI